MICRGLRLELMAGVGLALAIQALPAAAENIRGLATQTTMTVETHDRGGRTQADIAVVVTAEDGLPASGAVAIEDHGRQLAGAALNSEGRATIALDFSAGGHSLRAAYLGDAAHLGSISDAATVHAQSSSSPDYQIGVAPASLSLTAGQSGNITASITPENSSNLTAPMFVTLSCSGLPDQSSCTFTPETVEILPNATSLVTSTMVIETQAASALAKPTERPERHPVAWALLLPGALGLAGLAWGGRRRRWLNRLTLVALVGFVSILGTTACNPRYNYFNHGPPSNPATPSGTFTINVVAQTSNGVTAITHSTTMVLTVK
jgi:hypothetical protein